MFIRVDNFEKKNEERCLFRELKVGETFVERTISLKPNFDKLFIKTSNTKSYCLESAYESTVTNDYYMIFPVDLEIRVKK